MEHLEIDNNLVKTEFHKSTEQFHIITAWVGLALNIIWCISDYFVLPDKFLAFYFSIISITNYSHCTFN